MRYILCIILLVSPAFSRATDIIPYQIEGTVQDSTIGFAYLFIAATSLQPSTLISVPINNNRFVIRGSVRQAEGRYSIARLFISQKSNMKVSEYNSLLQKGKLEYLELVLEKELSVTIGPEMEISALEGGNLNDEYNTLQEISLTASSRNDSLKKWYAAELIRNKKFPVEIRKIQESYYRLSTEQQDRQTSELLHYIAANPSSVFALEKLDVIASAKDNGWRKFMRDFEQILSVVPDKWLQSTIGRSMVRKINMVKFSKQLKTGSLLPDYVFRDGSDSVSVRDFRGKFLLVHFWTSWSENCLIAQNDLVKAFANYKHKGFSILQISLDANIASWKNALPVDVTWKQVRCKAGWDAQVEKTFEIYGVPANYLVDQDGKIISSNLLGNKLEEKLAELMH